jgi:hypothetical protein
MGVERRGRVAGFRSAVNQYWEESDGRNEAAGETV